MQIPLLESIAAQRIISRAVVAAHEQGIAIAAMVVDAGGHLIAFIRMDGVSPMAIDSTRRKALTAWSFRMPTKSLGAISSFDPVAGADIAKNPDMCMVPGGLPIMLDGHCVGGIGIGGGRSEQDQAIVEQALAAL